MRPVPDRPSAPSARAASWAPCAHRTRCRRAPRWGLPGRSGGAAPRRWRGEVGTRIPANRRSQQTRCKDAWRRMMSGSSQGPIFQVQVGLASFAVEHGTPPKDSVEENIDQNPFGCRVHYHPSLQHPPSCLMFPHPGFETPRSWSATSKQTNSHLEEEHLNHHRPLRASSTPALPRPGQSSIWIDSATSPAQRSVRASSRMLWASKKKSRWLRGVDTEVTNEIGNRTNVDTESARNPCCYVCFA